MLLAQLCFRQPSGKVAVHAGCLTVGCNCLYCIFVCRFVNALFNVQVLPWQGMSGAAQDIQAVLDKELAQTNYRWYAMKLLVACL